MFYITAFWERFGPEITRIFFLKERVYAKRIPTKNGTEICYFPLDLHESFEEALKLREERKHLKEVVHEQIYHGCKELPTTTEILYNDLVREDMLRRKTKTLNKHHLDDIQAHLDRLNSKPVKKKESRSLCDAPATPIGDDGNDETAELCFEDREISDSEFSNLEDIKEEFSVEKRDQYIDDNKKYVQWLEKMYEKGKLYKKTTRYYTLYFVQRETQEGKELGYEEWDDADHWSVPHESKSRASKDAKGSCINIHFTFYKDGVLKRIGGMKALNRYKEVYKKHIEKSAGKCLN